MTESALDKHRLTQIQWHLCTEQAEMHEIMEISIERRNKEIIKSDVFMLSNALKAVQLHTHSDSRLHNSQVPIFRFESYYCEK